jgi:centrosomal protein CEP104
VQGRDDLGRPLLQRALRIQQAHLGPDHPDVQAIRDVLLEEEGGEG